MDRLEKRAHLVHALPWSYKLLRLGLALVLGVWITGAWLSIGIGLVNVATGQRLGWNLITCGFVLVAIAYLILGWWPLPLLDRLGDWICTGVRSWWRR